MDMQRYFFQISYDGSPFSGWQRQDNAPSVQQCIEDALSKLFRTKIDVTGCGRTDAGVHAADYYLHVDIDLPTEKINDLVFKLNMMLPTEICINRIFPVEAAAHARFDAISRAYTYNVHFGKDPFISKYSYQYNQSGKPDFSLMQEAAALIMNYDSFFPFCKSKTDVTNYDCNILHSNWRRNNEAKWTYHISANRFLRGMVRLIVGMCINVERFTLKDVALAVDNQERLSLPWSVPARGLSLTEVQYPFLQDKN